jgi:hypothetical protein
MASRVRSKSLKKTANFVLTCDPKGSPVRAVYAAESGKNASPFDATVRLLKGDEEYNSGGHNGRIKYQYAKDALTSVKVEDGGVHDGKTWTARLQPLRELAAR